MCGTNMPPRTFSTAGEPNGTHCTLLCGQTSREQLSLQQAQALTLKNDTQVLASQFASPRAGEIVTETRSAFVRSFTANVTGAQGNSQAGSACFPNR